MKLIVVIILLTKLASAAETKTECPMIKQMERRANPKAKLLNVSTKIRNNLTKSAITAAQ